MAEEFKFAIFGSAADNYTKEHEALALKLADYLVEKNIHVLSGGVRGLPGVVSKRVFELGGHTVAYSPGVTPEKYDAFGDMLERDYFRQIIWRDGFGTRSLEMIADCDAAIVLNGRMGTLSEYAFAYEEGTNLGVLLGSGGVSDILPQLHKFLESEIPKKQRVNRANFFDNDPVKLVDLLTAHVEEFGSNKNKVLNEVFAHPRFLWS